jgi:hypothetical protein
MLVITAFWKQKQEDPGFEGSLGYIMRHCFKKKKRENSKWQLK